MIDEEGEDNGQDIQRPLRTLRRPDVLQVFQDVVEQNCVVAVVVGDVGEEGDVVVGDAECVVVHYDLKSRKKSIISAVQKLYFYVNLNFHFIWRKNGFFLSFLKKRKSKKKFFLHF